MPTVFVSYRRGDSEGQARALQIELARLLGENSVFMDVDSIALGQDFRRILTERLESCDLMLALIGPGWLDSKDSAGRRRLDDASDFVRQEIAAALKRNIPVTPVLIQGAQMPSPERLPDDIRNLVYRNGFELAHGRWESDVSEMAKRLGLARESTAPGRGSPRIGGNAVTRLANRFQSQWMLMTVVAIAIVATSFFYAASRRTSLEGSWYGSPDCTLIFTKDDGTHFDGNCDNSGFRHSFVGEYLSRTNAKLTITRLDRSANCSITIAGDLEVIDRDTIRVSQDPWVGCQLKDPVASQPIVFTRPPSWWQWPGKK